VTVSDHDKKVSAPADPELLLMGRLKRLLDAAPAECRRRALQWLVSRYAADLATATPECRAVPLFPPQIPGA
jgi:hypothetical protein